MAIDREAVSPWALAHLVPVVAGSWLLGFLVPVLGREMPALPLFLTPGSQCGVLKETEAGR